MPTMYILVPSGLNRTSCGVLSCEVTEKFCAYEAVDTSNPVDKLYWSTVSPVVPMVYISVPSLLKVTSVAVSSSVAIDLY